MLLYAHHIMTIKSLFQRKNLYENCFPVINIKITKTKTKNYTIKHIYFYPVKSNLEHLSSPFHYIKLHLTEEAN